jgi:hypothetical protein
MTDPTAKHLTSFPRMDVDLLLAEGDFVDRISALPWIKADLRLGDGQLQWVVSAM